MNIFPMVQPDTAGVKASELPLFKEVKWDYGRDCPVYEKGQPVIITGADAVAVWAWNALYTVRGRHPIFSRNYGNDVEKLIGQPYIAETKKAEAIRYIRECLECSPYIKAVTDIQVSFKDGDLFISADMESIYGHVKVERGLGQTYGGI